MHENDASVYKFFYDKDGRCTKEEYYDNKGNLCLNFEGYAMCVRQYNQNGTCDKIMYFNQNGDLIVPKNIGYAAFTVSYNKNKKTKIFLDQNFEYVKQKSGIVFIIETFDDKKNLIKIEYLDENCKHCLYNNQYSYIVYEYDQNNNCTREAYFGADSKPCKVNGNFEIQTKFNANNKIIERKYIK